MGFADALFDASVAFKGSAMSPRQIAQCFMNERLPNRSGSSRRARSRPKKEIRCFGE
jgi:hypothetical protein